MVLSLLLYLMCFQGLGELHLLIVQPNLDYCLGYGHRFCFGKEGSGFGKEGMNRNWWRLIVLPKHEGKGQQLGSLLKVLAWVQPSSTWLSLNAVPCISFIPWLTSSPTKEFLTKCQGRLLKPWSFFNKSWNTYKWL